MSMKLEGRFRPFNDRGMKMGAKCGLERNKQQTIIRNLSKFSDPNKNKQTEHTFSFDYSIWSFERFKTDKNGYSEPVGSNCPYVG